MSDGKIILKGEIELLSPALIGSGNDDFSDIDVLLDKDEKPFIPATSFIGVLRHYIKSEDITENQKETFWGFTRKKEGHQSSILCSDLSCINKFTIKIRDGIKIDNKTGIVKNKGKYDYQVIERGAKFSLNIEANYSDKKFIHRMIATICQELERENIRVGAKTNNGLGKIRLNKKEFYDFDFSKKEDVLRWLKRDFSTKSVISEPPFTIKSEHFTIDATFDLKSSLIIRSYSEDPGAPDAVHIRSGNDNVLTGSSIKGAIRARAERIINTLGKPSEIIEKLFGNVDDEKRSTEARKGKIRVEEVILPKFISEVNNRIKIDRFTGGTIESALFDTMPVYTDFKDRVRNVKITINKYKPHEAGLILLVLKDLWTGDLAVGGEKNIGRGVFNGCYADISWNTHDVHIESDHKKISNEAKKQLEDLVKALVCYEEEGDKL
ncbi:MAG: RAMP superfamily CRISPR-associated protein [Candidatus Eremiobacterota bacterium]